MSQSSSNGGGYNDGSITPAPDNGNTGNGANAGNVNAGGVINTAANNGRVNIAAGTVPTAAAAVATQIQDEQVPLAVLDDAATTANNTITTIEDEESAAGIADFTERPINTAIMWIVSVIAAIFGIDMHERKKRKIAREKERRLEEIERDEQRRKDE